MSPFGGLTRAWRWIARKILGLWVKVTIKPDDIAAALAREHAAGLLCARAREPYGPRGLEQCVRGAAPTARLSVASRWCARRLFPRSAQPPAEPLATWSQLVEAAAADPGFDIDLVPVAIFLGRAPQKEESLWRLLFTEDWVLVGRFRKLLNVLFNGRNTVVYFGEPIRLRDAIGDLPPTRSVRRLLRALRAEFRAQRASTIGPDLSHRRTMVAHILRTQAVRHAVRREMQARAALAQNARGRARTRQLRRARRRAVLRTARKYAMEIAANYSQPFVTFMAARAGPAVEPAVRRRGIRARRKAARDRRRRRDHLCSLPSQPHGLSSAFLRDLPQGIRRPARGRRRESRHAGDRTFPAQGRRVLSAPQLQGRRAVRRGVHANTSAS